MTHPSYTPPRPRGGYARTHWRKRLGQHGGSISLYIPWALCCEVGLNQGMEVMVYLVNGAICIEPAPAGEFTPRVQAAGVGDRAQGTGDSKSDAS
jgi:antitoxin component of MazEF toxin-antitoxin module